MPLFEGRQLSYTHLVLHLQLILYLKLKKSQYPESKIKYPEGQIECYTSNPIKVLDPKNKGKLLF